MTDRARRSNYAWIPLLVLSLCAAVSDLRAESLTVTTYAGPNGGAGAVDGPPSVARFNNPWAVAVDAAGNVYVADTGSNAIRRISPAGVTTTLAGIAGRPAGNQGSADGTGGAALLNGPGGVAIDAAGNVYFSDMYNQEIRKVSPAGVVTTIAGKPGPFGFLDGVGTAAKFTNPAGLAVDAAGNLYVADEGNHAIRKITPDGMVTTLAGNGAPGSTDGTGAAASFNRPNAVAVDAAGNVYVADTSNYCIRAITPGGVVTTLAGNPHSSGVRDGTGSAANFNAPFGIAIDKSGNIYVAEHDADQYNTNNRIRKVTLGGVVTTFAAESLTTGNVNGQGKAARFYKPTGVAVDKAGNIYVADSGNHAIRKITPDAIVTTLSGSTFDIIGRPSRDGVGNAAEFDLPTGVACDAAGNVYVSDFGSYVIRKVTPDGTVSTFAGTPGPQEGAKSVDGVGAAASFAGPYALAIDKSGNLYTADGVSGAIRKITPDGTVSTIAGGASAAPADKFNNPTGIAVDGSGNIYVADTGYNIVRKITPAGAVSTIAGFPGKSGSKDDTGIKALFNAPTALAVDAAGNVFVSDSGNHTIRKIAPDGTVTTVAGTSGVVGFADGIGPAAQLNDVNGMAVDKAGNVIFSDGEINAIRKLTPKGAVTTLAGVADDQFSLTVTIGDTDGTGRRALFDKPAGVAIDAAGNIFIADELNDRVRKAVPSILDTATIDSAVGNPGETRQLDAAPQSATTFLWSLIRRPSNSAAQLSDATLRNPTFTPDIADIFIFQLVASGTSGKRFRRSRCIRPQMRRLRFPRCCRSRRRL